MKTAGVKMNLENGTANIFGKRYCIELNQFRTLLHTNRQSRKDNCCRSVFSSARGDELQGQV